MKLQSVLIIPVLSRFVKLAQYRFTKFLASLLIIVLLTKLYNKNPSTVIIYQISNRLANNRRTRTIRAT
jgi:hypothetical protein